MTSTHTTTKKTNHYFRALVALAALAMMAMLLTVGKTAQASTTFTVNSAADFADVNPGDGVCDADAAIGNLCTLRAAINESNVTVGVDTIDFNIGGTGVRTISPQTNLPNIIEPVTINGFTQPGSSPNTLSKGTNAKLMIELNGSGVTGTFNSVGLRLGAPDIVVQGLVINRFVAGVQISDNADAVRLQQNFIGTNPSGTQDLGNSIGVAVQGFGNSIGGTFPQDANLISGNDGAGIAIRSPASNTGVAHNLIGTDKSGTKRLGNFEAGVEIADSSNNFVENNTIAFNGKDGVSVAGGGGRTGIIVSANTILSNSIFSNGGLGINLIKPVELPVGESDGPTPNDTGDADSGPNGLQNKPVLTVAKTVSGKTTIKGKLNSHPNETYKIQLFSNPARGSEGKKLIAEKSITTDGSGNRSFTFTPAKVAVGRTITATATRDSTIDTSEFSAPRKVASS